MWCRHPPRHPSRSHHPTRRLEVVAASCPWGPSPRPTPPHRADRNPVDSTRKRQARLRVVHWCVLRAARLVAIACSSIALPFRLEFTPQAVRSPLKPATGNGPSHRKLVMGLKVSLVSHTESYFVQPLGWSFRGAAALGVIALSNI